MSDSSRLAFIAPTLTDMNRGDQALVWEAVALAEETGGFDELALVDAGQAPEHTEAQIGQSRALGHAIARSLLQDPRRGRNRAHDKIKESKASFARLVGYALWDLASQLWLLAFARVPAIARFVLDRQRRETFDLIRRSRAMFIKGGGFVHAHGEARAPYYIWHALFYLRLAHRLGVPVYLLPNSFGPFEGRTVKRQVRSVLGKCRFVAARESISAKMLGDLLGREIPVYPDMGYFLDAAEENVGREACRAAGVPLGEKPCVALTVRPWRFPGSERPEESFATYLDAMAALVRRIADRGMHPVLVAHVLGPSAHENDNLAIDELIPRLAGTSYSRVDAAGTCRDLKSIYACMDFVVGTRFHSVIFAQGAGVPALAIGYGGNKGVGIMNDMGLGDFVVPIEEVSAEPLCRRFDQLVDRREKVVGKLKAWMDRAEQGRRAMLEFITADLEGRATRPVKSPPSPEDALVGSSR